MSKYGMSMYLLGMSEEFRPERIAVNALWPRVPCANDDFGSSVQAREIGRMGQADRLGVQGGREGDRGRLGHVGGSIGKEAVNSVGHELRAGALDGPDGFLRHLPRRAARWAGRCQGSRR
jgi:hypothetical protein